MRICLGGGVRGRGDMPFGESELRCWFHFGEEPADRVFRSVLVLVGGSWIQSHWSVVVPRTLNHREV